MYKITNKKEIYLKYMDIVFAPKETKILELDNPPKHEAFDIEKLEENKKSKLKGGK